MTAELARQLWHRVENLGPVLSLVWLGLAALSIVLLVMMRTRWGRTRPLGKCVVLSLFAHVILALYATTVQIVTSGPPLHREIRVQLGGIEEAVAADERERDREVRPDASRPWELFAEGPVEVLTPEEAGEPLVPPETPDASSPADESLVAAPPLPVAAPELPRLDPPREELPLAQAPASTPDTVEPAPAESLAAPSATQASAPEIELDSPAALPEQAALEPESTPTPAPPAGLPPSLLTSQPELAPLAADPAELADTLTGAASPAAAAAPAPAEPIDAAPRLADTAAETLQVPSLPGDAPLLEPVPRRSIDRILVPTLLGDQQPSGLSIPSATPQLAIPAPPVAQQLPPRTAAPRAHQPPATYRLRQAPGKLQLVEQAGGSSRTEAAVRAALRWLADNQDADGRWNGRRHGAGRELLVLGQDRGSAGTQADAGMTALALLAFLGAGETHTTGQYRSTVERGIEHLLSIQHPSGHLAGQALINEFMYCHGMATLALSEAYGMTGDERLREPVRRAIGYTLAAQHPVTGGWRYRPGDTGDTSQFGWQVMALRSAEAAGIPVPAAAKAGMVRFLESVCYGQHGGLASYRPNDRVSRTMTAEALVCRQFLQVGPSRGQVFEASQYVLQEPPGAGPPNLYYWYYATLGLYQAQGEAWQRWNEALTTNLVSTQRLDGTLAGSWDPTCVWGGYGGRVYSTAMAALSLEVYYRFLPLYLQAADAAAGAATETR